MFIYSIKAKTIKMFGLICVALVGVIMLAAFMPGYVSTSAATNSEIDYSGIRNNEDRIGFLRQFGWEVSPEEIESEQVTIPAEFDKIFARFPAGEPMPTIPIIPTMKARSRQIYSSIAVRSWEEISAPLILTDLSTDLRIKNREI